MKLTSVQTFVAVVKAGSIHAAARDMGVSQPAVSKSLRALEDDLAAPLLTRSSHGVELTAYGKAFYQRAHVVIDELRKATEDVAQLRGILEGRLSIAVAPASTMQFAPMVIRDFRRVCPEVELHIVEGIWPSVAVPLRDGSIDLLIGPVPDEIPRSELTVEPLFAVEMAVVMRPGHPLAKATSLKELMQAQWLHQGTGGSASVLIRRVFAEQNLPVPPVSVESQSLIATVMMLQSMDLVALLPRAMLQMDALKGALVALDLTEQFSPNQLGLIYRSDRVLTRVGQLFATHARRTAAHLSQPVRGTGYC